MEHFYNLNKEPFYFMSHGLKDIEMRLFDGKRKLINIGDIIYFENNETHEVIKTVVIGLHRFPSFKELYETFPKTRLGYFENEEASYHDMNRYYTEERIKECGVIGIEIKLIDNK